MWLLIALIIYSGHIGRVGTEVVREFDKFSDCTQAQLALQNRHDNNRDMAQTYYLCVPVDAKKREQ